MARPVSIEQLRADVADQCDVAVGSTGRYSASLINRYLNKSIQRFRERLSTEGITHYLVSSSGTLSSGATSPYPFKVLDMSGFSPAVVRTFGVDITCNGVVRSLEHRPFQDRAVFGNTNDTGAPIAWAHYQTDKIAIFPAPDAGYSYTVWYLPVYDDLDNGDSFDGVAGWEDYLVQDVVCRLISRDQYREAYAQANAQREGIWADILRAATKVSAAGGAVRGRDTFGAFGVGYARGARGVAAAGGVASDGSITNAKLAEMAAGTVKANTQASPASPQDIPIAQLAPYFPSFAGAAGGLVPTGAGNPALFLSNAGSWLAPSIGGSVSGVALTQLQDIHSPRVIGLFGTPTGAPTLLTGQHVASMIGVVTGSAHGFVPCPTGPAQGRAFLDNFTWGTPSGVGNGGGGSSDLVLGGPTGAVQFNGGTGLAGASGFRYHTGTGLRLHDTFSIPTGSIVFGASGLPAIDQGLILVPHGSPIISAKDANANQTSAAVLRYGGTGVRDDVVVLGGNVAIGTEQRTVAGGDHRGLYGNVLRHGANREYFWGEAGFRIGLQQLAVPDTVGDKLASWTASGFANHATGINVTASGTRLSIGSGGPQLHPSGIDMRSSDIRNARKINGLFGIKTYGELPDADANITAPSGTVFIIPPNVTAGHIYSIVPSGSEHGDVVLVENYSAFAHSIYNTGTGMGAPSGFIATLAPSGGMSARNGSGAFYFGVKYKFGGF